MITSDQLKRQAAEHPLVKAVMSAFPGASIDAVRDLVEADAGATDESEAAAVMPADPEFSSGDDES